MAAESSQMNGNRPFGSNRDNLKRRRAKSRIAEGVTLVDSSNLTLEQTIQAVLALVPAGART